MLKYDNVTKTYKDGTTALQGVTLEIRPAEFVFLVGPSGSGKTTLIKMLIREELPSSGSVYLDDKDITKLKDSEVPNLRRLVGVVFQDFKLLPSKTVYENVAVALEVVETPDAEIKQIVPNALNLVGLSTRMNAFPHQLSGGEKQRLAIARALSHEPKILVADEPTGNIDPVASNELVNLLEKINSIGTTVIVATHDAEIVNRLKKRVIVIEDGRVVKDREHARYEI